MNKYLSIKRIINYIKSNDGIALFTILSLLVTIGNTSYVFSRLSHFESEEYKIIHGILFAIVFDFAVLAFVLRGRERISWLFSVFQIVMNVIYYWSNIENPGEKFAAIFISIILPIIIALFSDEISKGVNKEEKVLEKDNESIIKIEKEVNIIKNFIDKLLLENKKTVIMFSDKLNEHNDSIDNLRSEYQNTLKTMNTNIQKLISQVNNLQK